MAFPFDSADTLSPEAETLQRGFSDLREKLAAEAKCVLDDCEDLILEKEEWCRRWNKISSDIGLIMAASKDKGIVLLLTVEEIALGKEMAGVHDRFVDEMWIIKDQAACQAEIQELQGAGPDMTMDGDGEEELEDEEEAPLKRLKWVRRKKVLVPEPDTDERGMIVVHEMKCARCETWELECAGPEGQGCLGCRAAKSGCSYSCQGAKAKGKASVPPAASVCQPAVGPKGQVASSCGSEGPDFMSDGETAPSVSKAPKVRPVVVLRAPKRKLAEMQGDDFALADSRLSGDDLVMAGKLWGLYAKVRTIQGLISEVANELDVMRAHLNNKGRF
ncbi:hypothetical protein EDB19DRAFT_1785489 [Suillus lakei]|nr:hypothetical protein EDB19DRAFT_1785489 [Suillus lakei]